MDEAAKRLVLVADDDEAARESVVSVVQELAGLNTITAADGREALHLARERQPDLILLDVALPKLDGLEVAARLKSNPETASIPIIILSGLTYAPQRALELGCEAYLRKPVDSAMLVSKIQELVVG